jgi:hypothetical protein
VGAIIADFRLPPKPKKVGACTPSTALAPYLKSIGSPATKLRELRAKDNHSTTKLGCVAKFWWEMQNSDSGIHKMLDNQGEVHKGGMLQAQLPKTLEALKNA